MRTVSSPLPSTPLRTLSADLEPTMPSSPWRPVTVGSPSQRRSPAIAHRRLQIVRALSCEVLGSQAAGGTNASPPRIPLCPLPPPITVASPASFGSLCDSDSDYGSDHGQLSGSAHHRAKIMRVRSFGATSRLSSMLGPSRTSNSAAPVDTLASLLGAPAATPAASASTSFRPPPIHTVASLEASSPGGFMAAATAGGAPLAVRTSSSSTGKSSPALPFAPVDISGEASPRTPGIAAPTPRRQRARHHHGFAAALYARGGGRSGRSSPMSKVAESLYVGDERAAANLAGLRAAGVTHVLNCTAHRTSLENDAAAPAYLQLGLLDSTADLPRMQAAMETGVEFIAEAIAAGGTVLVHCHRGISRSATLAMAYLIRATQQPLDGVFERMRRARRCVDPNLGYMCALKEWEQRVLPPSVLRRAGSSGGSPAAFVTGSPRPLSRA